MNTKTDQISSGLVALAWLDSNADMSDEAFLWDKDSSTGHVEAVVRLSDAEAIIAAKDAEIERLAIYKNLADEYGLSVFADLKEQDERIKELESELEESDAIRDRCAHLLAETAVALKGPEKALHRHGWQDLPEVAAKQSAALKLAREALFDMQDSYAAVHGWKDSFVIAATTALAAIDEVLKGEVK